MVIIVGVVIFFAVFFPNIAHVERLGRQENYIMNEGWYSSCTWLEDNSPEPFGDPDFYYELYPPRDEYKYPETAYGVMSWWDYGYFITQISHRIPNANPTQSGAARAGQFFTAQNVSSANELADRFNSKYVMIDYAMVTGKFYAMVEWAGGNVDEFYDVYYAPVSNVALQPVYLYYPAYYQSTTARLYNFECKAAEPSDDSALAISYERMAGDDLLRGGYQYIIVGQNRVTAIEKGIVYKVIGDYSFFSNYEEAKTYIVNQPPGNYDAGGNNPFATIVPLDALNSYELVHSSGDTTSSTTVKIFEYFGSDEP
jgi:asparagine N-glycosylation enzyme membrane subunit Stt3